MKKTKLLIVFGTRPEVIKLAGVISAARKESKTIDVKVCLTGQHREMVDPLLKLFDIKPDVDLNIMMKNQDLAHISSHVLEKITNLLKKEKPDFFLVQGDTTTAMAGALAAFYQKVKIAHVEAGLRTGNIQHPFPEEANRRIIDSISDLFFAHTKSARDNLVREGISRSKIEVTGNTVIDALLGTVDKKCDLSAFVPKGALQEKRKLILVTAHRRENFGKPIMHICQAIKMLAKEYRDKLVFVYPVHLNPNIIKPVHQLLDGKDNVFLIKPLEYLPFVKLMARAHLILTDSGGLQEEAPSLGKPVLVMRETTERPEGVEAGCVKLVGTDTKKIVREVKTLLENEKIYTRMTRVINPYGDGLASQRIISRIIKENTFGKTHA